MVSFKRVRCYPDHYYSELIYRSHVMVWWKEVGMCCRTP